MPKSKKISTVPTNEEAGNEEHQPDKEEEEVTSLGISAFELPKAVIVKLAKSTGSTNMKLAKEVPLALTQASTVFISYLVSIAQGIAADRSERSLSARHILEACNELDWANNDELLRTLKIELEAFRKLSAAKKAQKTVVNRPEPTTSVIQPNITHPEVSGLEQIDEALESDAADEMELDHKSETREDSPQPAPDHETRPTTPENGD